MIVRAPKGIMMIVKVRNTREDRMLYLKRVLVGAAVFSTSVFLFNLTALLVTWLFPGIGTWLFPENYHELGWGWVFEFPLWQSCIVGVIACAIAFVWMLKKARTLRAGTSR
jgi:hypothetical protein